MKKKKRKKVMPDLKSTEQKTGTQIYKTHTKPIPLESTPKAYKKVTIKNPKQKEPTFDKIPALVRNDWSRKPVKKAIQKSPKQTKPSFINPDGLTL